MTVADTIVSRLVGAGTRAIFGMPGGGSNLDLIAAAQRHDLPFVLSQTETAGAIMASAQAEVTGAPGACLSTLGPGVSSLVNGVAHAWLDRAPVVVLTDAMDLTARRHYEHQNLPHAALLRPITRFSEDLVAERVDAQLTEALARATGDPSGPVHLDCAHDVIGAPAAVATDAASAARPPSQPNVDGNPAQAAASRLLRQSKRPLVIVGLGARRVGDVAAVRRLCETCGLPVLVTYKAKGVVPDDHSLYAGLFTLGRIEQPLVESSDLIVTVGLDPVELLPRAWPYGQPVVHCTRSPAESDQLPPGHTLVGDIAAILRHVQECLPRSSNWTLELIAAHRERQRAAVIATSDTFTPDKAADAVAREATHVLRVTVDAGAHMFPAMALVPARMPSRILISNGLSTMGYAVPAAIGAALLDRRQPVVAITGDGGLLMCLGELRTAAREELRLVVVVLADGELSLIRIKQDRRGLDPVGVRLGDMDWPSAAAALGLRAYRACDAATLRRHLSQALAAPGPSLIEARVDPGGYGSMLKALRG
jgi:acetolactate synthase I/II/III large subunit